MQQTRSQEAGWVIETRTVPRTQWHPRLGIQTRNLYFFLKRLMDIVIASVGLIVLAPFMLLVAVLIRLDSPGPALFKQQRVTSSRQLDRRGENWQVRTFTCYKFRSMFTNTNSELHQAFIEAFIKNDHEGMTEVQGEQTDACKLVHDPRISRMGRFIRKTSIDELPQLINVLKGDMTVVGPRPAILYEVEMYQAWHRKRLEAKPGLTGWWQIHGRGVAEFDEGVQQDIWYVENQSLVLDLRIMLETPQAVFRGKGAH